MDRTSQHTDHAKPRSGFTKFVSSVAKAILFNFGRVLECTALGRKIIAYGRLGLYLRDRGWLKSAGSRIPMGRFEEPLPWICYPCMDFLNERLKSDMDVFEWGSGNSTLWWAKRVGTVISCEHDQGWYERMKPAMPDNVEYVHANVEDSSYINFAKNQQKRFDVMMIDGQARIACAKNCLESLKEGGVVVWDNTDVDKYQEGYDFLIQNGFKRLDFYGLGPVNFYGWSTSVFYKENNCLGL